MKRTFILFILLSLVYSQSVSVKDSDDNSLLTIIDVGTTGNVGIGTATPSLSLDVNGNSASNNQVSIIPLWQPGSNFTMSNTSGSDLTNCESGIDPTIYDANGNIEVKLVIRITSTSAGTNNFQLRTHDGTTQHFPIVNTDSWTFSATQSGIVVVSPWKDWSAGTNVHEIHLFGWVDVGSTNFNSAYLMIRPDR